MTRSSFFSRRSTALAMSGLLLVAVGARPAGAQVQLPVGGAHYTITQAGKTVGDAQYSVATIPGGYSITSSGHMALAKFTYSFENQATVDGSLNLVRDALTGSVNGTKAHASDIRFNTASDATGRELQINIAAEGKQTTNTVDRHRNTVLTPDLDPGAYMLMARIALVNPETAWVLIPKENGLLVPAAYQAKGDVQGTFRGATVDVKHTTAALSDANSITLELYYTGDGQLMEADLNAQNFYVVRDGFHLLQHLAPTPPPPGQAPPQPGQQDGAQGEPRQAPPPQ